jgi:hypothetical protein
MSIIAEQLARRSRQKGKVKVTDDDRAFLRSLYEFATGVDLASIRLMLRKLCNPA